MPTPPPEVPQLPPTRLYALSDRIARLATDSKLPEPIRFELASISFGLHTLARDIDVILGMDAARLNRAIDGIKTLIALKQMRDGR
jgi:hypothetical protein